MTFAEEWTAARSCCTHARPPVALHACKCQCLASCCTVCSRLLYCDVCLALLTARLCMSVAACRKIARMLGPWHMDKSEALGIWTRVRLALVKGYAPLTQLQHVIREGACRGLCRLGAPLLIDTPWHVMQVQESVVPVPRDLWPAQCALRQMSSWMTGGFGLWYSLIPPLALADMVGPAHQACAVHILAVVACWTSLPDSWVMTRSALMA